MQEQSNAITLELPPEFVRLCEIDGIDPAQQVVVFTEQVHHQVVAGYEHLDRGRRRERHDETRQARRSARRRSRRSSRSR